jgi:hypothetical protein
MQEHISSAMPSIADVRTHDPKSILTCQQVRDVCLSRAPSFQRNSGHESGAGLMTRGAVGSGSSHCVGRARVFDAGGDTKKHKLSSAILRLGGQRPLQATLELRAITNSDLKEAKALLDELARAADLRFANDRFPEYPLARTRRSVQGRRQPPAICVADTYQMGCQILTAGRDR